MDAGVADVIAREADASPPGLSRDRRRVARRPRVRQRALVAGMLAPRDRHFSTPVTTTPRMNARWARKKMITGIAIVISADAWIRFGWDT